MGRRSQQQEDGDRDRNPYALNIELLVRNQVLECVPEDKDRAQVKSVVSCGGGKSERGPKSPEIPMWKVREGAFLVILLGRCMARVSEY